VKQKGSDWRNVETQLIQQSKIICCTLSLAGQDKLDILKDQVDYLIVDEACQCIEPASLIPFELGPNRVILVGDQN
jgi:senataxin